MSRRQMSVLDRPSQILLISGNRSRPLPSPGDGLAYNSLPASWIPSNTPAWRCVRAWVLGGPWLRCMMMTGVLYMTVGLMVWSRSCPMCWMSSICENPCSEKRCIYALCNIYARARNKLIMQEVLSIHHSKCYTVINLRGGVAKP